MNPLKQLAKCVNMLHTTDGEHLVIRKPLALCYIPHINCVGAPSKLHGLGKGFV